jgi:hypothetical protein
MASKIVVVHLQFRNSAEALVGVRGPILQRILTSAVARQQAFFQTVKWSARDR